LYIPALYREEDRQKIIAFLSQNNFPAIVSFDGEKPVATHAPVEVTEDENGSITIYGHFSRANPQWKTFGQQEVLLIFQGAHTYISPRWYNHVNVPTWNYMMVHVYGTVRMVQGEELFALLSRLVHQHEVNSPYRLESLPQEFVQKEIKGVVGFAIHVSRIEAGYKLSQNRSDEDHDNIVRELDQRSDVDSAKIARAMWEKRKENRRKGVER
jgi:transcriptional regulator